MEEYWDTFCGLDTWMQAYWVCAVVGTVVFAVQMVLVLIGMDSTDTDVDFDGADTMDLGGGLSLFSIKNFVNFLVGFGWTGICLNDVIANRWLLGLMAIAVGVAFVYMFFVIKKQTKKLEHNGAFRIEDCVGETVDVYLRIPGKKQGKGKVQVSFNGSVQEIEAMTEDEDIASGRKAVVVDVIDGGTLLVK